MSESVTQCASTYALGAGALVVFGLVAACGSPVAEPPGHTRPSSARPSASAVDRDTSASGTSASGTSPSGTSASGTSAGVALPPVERLRVLFSALQTIGAERDRHVRALHDLRATVSAGEQALIDRVLEATRLFGALVSKPLASDLRALLAAELDVLRGFGALYPDDGTVQRAVVASFNMLPAQAQSYDLEAEEAEASWRRETLERAKALVGHFPKDASAQNVRTVVCVSAHEPPLECLRHAARCLALDPDDARCRKQYRDLATDYVRPYCTSADVARDLEVYAARWVVHPEPGDRSVTHGGQTYVLEALPALGASDLALLHGAVQMVQVNDEPQREVPAVAVTIAPVANERWARLSEALRGPNHSLVWVRGRGTEVLAVLAGQRSRIPSPFVVTGVALERLCARVVRDALPADLPALP